MILLRGTDLLYILGIAGEKPKCQSHGNIAPMRLLDVRNRIQESLSLLAYQVKSSTALGQSDINKVAETLLIPVLDIAFGCELRNLNFTEHKNYPAVDLGDDKHRIAIQITSTATYPKVRETLETFLKFGLDARFDRLIIFILSERQSSYPQQSIDEIIGERFTFDGKRDILDGRDLLAQIGGLQLADSEKILEHLSLGLGSIGHLGFVGGITDSLIAILEDTYGGVARAGLLMSSDGYAVTATLGLPSGKDVFGVGTVSGPTKARIIAKHPSGITLLCLDQIGIFRPYSREIVRMCDAGEQVTAWSIDAQRTFATVVGRVTTRVYNGERYYLECRLAIMGQQYFGAPVINANGGLVGIVNSFRRVSGHGSNYALASTGNDISDLLNAYVDVNGPIRR